MSVSIPTPTILFNIQPPTSTSTMQRPTTTMMTPLTLMPEQIRRRLMDYDMQVQQGLEEGSIQQVMKVLSPDLVSPVCFFSVRHMADEYF
jgi:hypothetical protein